MCKIFPLFASGLGKVIDFLESLSFRRCACFAR